MKYLENAKITPVLIISFLLSIVFTLQKKAINLNNNIVLLSFLKIFLIGLIGLISFALYSNKNEIITDMRKIDKKTLLILGISCLLEFITVFYYFKTMKNNDASWSIPLIESGTVLVTVLLSVYFLKEKITFTRIFGIIEIILGIFLINKS